MERELVVERTRAGRHARPTLACVLFRFLTEPHLAVFKSKQERNHKDWHETTSPCQSDSFPCVAVFNEVGPIHEQPKGNQNQCR